MLGDYPSPHDIFPGFRYVGAGLATCGPPDPSDPFARTSAGGQYRENYAEYFEGFPGDAFRNGNGLSHILAKHGTEALEGAIEAIANGRARRSRDPRFRNRRWEIEHEGNIAILEDVRGPQGQEPIRVMAAFRKGPRSKTDFPLDLSKLDGAIFYRGGKK